MNTDNSSLVMGNWGLLTKGVGTANDTFLKNTSTEFMSHRGKAMPDALKDTTRRLNRRHCLDGGLASLSINYCR